MKFVLSKDLTTDMIPVRNIYNRNRDLLLAANHRLTPQIISGLQKMNYSGIMVYDEYSDIEEYKEYLS